MFLYLVCGKFEQIDNQKVADEYNQVLYNGDIQRIGWESADFILK